MRYAIFLLIAAIPLLEIVLLVQIGKAIGAWWTVLLVIGTAAAGSFVLHRQGFALMNRVVETMAAGKPPVAPVIEGGFLMLAGLLLITPGIITDALGILLLIPKLRHTVAAWSVRRVFRSMKARSAAFSQHTAQADWPGQTAERPGRNAHDPAHAPGEGPVIDGEFERLGERHIDPRRANGDARRPMSESHRSDTQH